MSQVITLSIQTQNNDPNLRPRGSVAIHQILKRRNVIKKLAYPNKAHQARKSSCWLQKSNRELWPFLDGTTVKLHINLTQNGPGNGHLYMSSGPPKIRSAVLVLGDHFWPVAFKLCWNACWMEEILEAKTLEQRPEWQSRIAPSSDAGHLYLAFGVWYLRPKSHVQTSKTCRVSTHFSMCLRYRTGLRSTAT